MTEYDYCFLIAIKNQQNKIEEYLLKQKEKSN